MFHGATLPVQTKSRVFDSPPPNWIDILFEDQVKLSDGYSKPYTVVLQLTSESLIVRPRDTIQTRETRAVTIRRDPVTRSLGFSIKGGADTGFPVLISRIVDTDTPLLHIGDAILKINNEDIAHLTHDQVMSKLHDASGDRVHLTIQHMNDMATYLQLTASSSLLGQGTDRKHNRLSFPLTNREKKSSAQTYSLLYAYVSQYVNGIDQFRANSFQLHTFDGHQSGLFITCTALQQNMWISRINLVIENLTKRLLADLNQRLLSNEQVFYASWLYQRLFDASSKKLPQWQAIFLVFKGLDLYLFDGEQTPPFCPYDFISCSHVHPLIEIFLKTTSRIEDRPYSFILTLPNDSNNPCRYLNFERQIQYEDFISHYRRSLYLAIYSIEKRTFGCLYEGQICRLVVDIHHGFQMFNNQTNILLWTYTFEQLQSSWDNGRDAIYFQFHRSSSSSRELEVHCQHLRVLVHVINAFLTVKFISQRKNTDGLN